MSDQAEADQVAKWMGAMLILAGIVLTAISNMTQP